jgi:hypothetical protein
MKKCLYCDGIDDLRYDSILKGYECRSCRREHADIQVVELDDDYAEELRHHIHGATPTE